MKLETLCARIVKKPVTKVLRLNSSPGWEIFGDDNVSLRKVDSEDLLAEIFAMGMVELQAPWDCPKFMSGLIGHTSEENPVDNDNIR